MPGGIASRLATLVVAKGGCLPGPSEGEVCEKRFEHSQAVNRVPGSGIATEFTFVVSSSRTTSRG
jgi:hypothetical protein